MTNFTKKMPQMILGEMISFLKEEEQVVIFFYKLRVEGNPVLLFFI